MGSTSATVYPGDMVWVKTGNSMQVIVSLAFQHGVMHHGMQYYLASYEQAVPAF